MMHNLILSPSAGMLVDHIDGNGLNNRRSNLRLATIQQNAFNNPPYRCAGKVSQYKGVHFEKSSKKFKAVIRLEGKAVTLGRFDSEVAAALAYNMAAMESFGSFARLNQIEATKNKGGT